MSLPTGHPPQRLDAAIDVAFALEEHLARVLDALALGVEVGEGGGADGLGLVGEGLGGAQALGGAVQAVGAGEQLLALLELAVGRARVGVVRVARPEQGGAVVGEAAELPLRLVDVRLEVAQPRVDPVPVGRGDVLLLQAHLAELWCFGIVVSTVQYGEYSCVMLGTILWYWECPDKQARTRMRRGVCVPILRPLRALAPPG